MPFVGAGVSIAVLDRETQQPLFPGWRQLLIAAAKRLDDEQKSREADLVRSLLNHPAPDFLEAAKRARNDLGSAWYDFLKEQIDIPRGRADDSSLQLAREVWELAHHATALSQP